LPRAYWPVRGAKAMEVCSLRCFGANHIRGCVALFPDGVRWISHQSSGTFVDVRRKGSFKHSGRRQYYYQRTHR